ANKIVQIRHVGEHVVADDEVGLPEFLRDAPGSLNAQELNSSADPPVYGDARDVGCRLDTKDRNRARAEVLQEVSVVAGDFHYLMLAAKPESGRDRVDVPTGVLDPTVR